MHGKKLYEFGEMFQPRLFTDQELADGLGRNMDGLEVIFLSARKDAQEISDSKNLTRSGKIDSLKTLSEKIDKETKAWRSSMHYSEMIKQVEGEMKPIKKRHDVIDEMQRREVRDHLKTLDPVLQESFYREAASSGNDLVLAAIQEAPVPFVFAAPDQIKKIQLQRLAVEYPTQAARLRDLEIAAQSANSALNSVRGALRTAGLNIGGVDPVAVLATA